MNATDFQAPIPAPRPDHGGFRDFYRAHVDFVWRRARRVVDDAAIDDIVQQVFLVAFRRYADFRPGDLTSGRSSTRAWLFAILARVVRQHRRTTRRKYPHIIQGQTDPESVLLPHHFGTHEAVARNEATRIVGQLLEYLDRDKRDVFILGELEQFTLVEIGEALGLNASTVSTRLQAARRDFERAAQRYHRRDVWKVG